MTKIEVALQLTLEAMDKGAIRFEQYTGTSSELETYNTFNAKQVSNFFNNVIGDIDTISHRLSGESQ